MKDGGRVVQHLLNPVRHVIPLRVSPGERELLRRLIEEDASESGEQLTQFEPGGWWLGSEQLKATICWRLIRHALISKEDFASGGVQYWSVNETGRRVVSDPTYVPWTIRMALGEKGPFSE